MQSTNSEYGSPYLLKLNFHFKCDYTLLFRFLLHKHDKNKCFVVNYSPSCRSKYILPSFIFRTQIKIFFDEIWEVSEKFRPSIDSNLSTYLSLQWSYAKIQTLTGNLMQLIQYYINYWAHITFLHSLLENKSCPCDGTLSKGTPSYTVYP